MPRCGELGPNSGMVVRLAWLFLALLVARAVAQEAFVVPEPETLHPPTNQRLQALLAAARRDGWAPQVAPLRTAAMQSYRGGNVYVADAWFHVCAWATLFGEEDRMFVPRWIQAVDAARVGHANMARDYPTNGTPLGAALSPELQRWLITNPTFSAEFFAVFSPVDYLPRVFGILDSLYRSEPTQFKAYPNLALAIAIVYDVPPPPYWPHSQVEPAALPRRLPPPVDAFRWWVRQDRNGRTFQSLRNLGADELKFVVDSAAPLSELEWSQQAIAVSLGDLPAAYKMVRYRTDRIGQNQHMWPGQTYRLPDIFTTGGICADQAFFAAEVGKARGVPTLIFLGAGNDARHAWFGYLDAAGQWKLDAARYAEEQFVTGVALDPQTWATISDHDLQFLAERFHARPSYRESSVHEEFAAMMLATGDAAGAARAARRAVDFEGRNQAGWDTLIAALRQQATEAKAVEAVLREAALALHAYPDLEAYYITRLAESLRSRGQTSEADAEVRRIAHKYQTNRVDISVQEASDIVRRAINTQTLAEQVRTYNSVIDSFAGSAGMPFFDNVVRVFVEHLLQLHHREDALRAIQRARGAFNMPPESQLDRELTRLQEKVTAATGEN